MQESNSFCVEEREGRKLADKENPIRKSSVFEHKFYYEKELNGLKEQLSAV